MKSYLASIALVAASASALALNDDESNAQYGPISAPDGVSAPE